MKGISPVIATVLLLLMAVASVGGAWVWYQRQSAVVGGKTEEKISEQVSQQTSASVSLAGLYKRSDGNLTLLINNAGTSAVNITGFKITSGGSTTVNTSVKKQLNSQSTAELATTVTCTSSKSVTVQLFVAGISTQDYTETCP